MGVDLPWDKAFNSAMTDEDNQEDKFEKSTGQWDKLTIEPSPSAMPSDSKQEIHTELEELRSSLKYMGDTHPQKKELEERIRLLEALLGSV